SLESVPKGIEQMFGLDMIREGYNNDANDVLTEAIDETSIWRFQLWFQDGRVYQFPYWINGLMRALVPAESKRRSAQGGSTAQAGYGQYTLCQSGAIFQFPPEQDGHRFPDDEGRGTVEMLIRAGRVLRIRETA